MKTFIELLQVLEFGQLWHSEYHFVRMNKLGGIIITDKKNVSMSRTIVHNFERFELYVEDEFE